MPTIGHLTGLAAILKSKHPRQGGQDTALHCRLALFQREIDLRR